MLNKSTSRSKYVVQSGVTQYPVGFEFFFNGDDTPQVAVSIGAEVPTLNRHYKFSDDLSTLILIPTEEEAADITGPEDFRWMDKWVGMELVIERDIPFVQESDYQLGRISPERIEKDFDLSVMRDQMLAGQIQEHTDDVQGEIDALNSRIDFVQEEHVLDMAAVDSQLATKAVKADVDAEFATVNADLATRATKTELENAKTVLGEGIQGNADAILKTRNDFTAADQAIRDDMNAEDGRLQSQITAHASAITTNKNDIDELGDQVAEIESKIPESASETNPLVTKGDLADIDLDGYVKKSGDTMTGDLVLDGHGASGLGPVINFVGLGPNPSNGQEFITTIDTFRGYGLSIKDYVDGEARNVLNFSDGFWGYSYINDKMLNSGSSLYPWKTTYTQVLNAGNKIVGDTTSEFSGDLIVPSEGGTLARMEDLIDLRADINEADSELQTQITAQAAEIATKAEKDSVYTKEQVDAKVSSVYKVKGSVANYDSLPTGANVGDVYNVLDTGVNYVWTADGWDALGGAVDLTDYAKKDDLSGYLPLTGGTLTGPVEIDYGKQEEIWDSIQLFTLTARTYQNYPRSLIFSYAPDLGQLFINGMNSLAGLRELLPHAIDPSSIGNSALPWATVYATKLNSGGSALSGHDLIVPTEGGTIARIEDINAAVGDISTALTAILGE